MSCGEREEEYNTHLVGAITCTKCNELRSYPEEFYKTYKTICKYCKRDDNLRRRRTQMAWLQKQKEKPCTDCKQTYPYYVMHWDHLGKELKLMNIGNMHSNSLAFIQKEIDKCELVCANCHAERTYQRQCQN